MKLTWTEHAEPWTLSRVAYDLLNQVQEPTGKRADRG